ncbi:helix-turn-helix domain-containing protein [Streptosporangium jomthongense]|uniref:Helix-turn-helix domain-containing protein n=1 Tax=Streptosporangium jomthongense TaxID=1193683 RepID=A0ABV8EY53_9ACTN
MPAPKKLDPNPKTPLAALGLALRRYREASGFTQEQLADRVSYSHSQVGQVERAGRRPSEMFIQQCDQVLGTKGALIDMFKEVVAEVRGAPTWFRSWMEVEALAASIQSWEPLVVPGLLQTAEYAHAVISGNVMTNEEQVEELTKLRMGRQSILQTSNAPLLWVVMDETVLMRPIGGKDVMRRQVERLLEAVKSPRIRVQIVPVAQGSTYGLLGGFVIAQIPGEADKVYLESPGMARITDAPEIVREISANYSSLRSEAESQRGSISIMKEMLKRWT